MGYSFRILYDKFANYLILKTWAAATDTAYAILSAGNKGEGTNASVCASTETAPILSLLEVRVFLIVRGMVEEGERS